MYHEVRKRITAFGRAVSPHMESAVKLLFGGFGLF